MKRKFYSYFSLSIVGLFAACTMAACSNNETNSNPPLVDDDFTMSFDVSTLQLNVGETYKLTLTIASESNTNRTYTISSTSEAIASVTQDGYVTANKTGRCVIVAACENKKAYCNLTVTGEEIKVTNIYFDISTLSLEVGASYKLNLNILPSNATNKSYTISSSNSEIASVTNDGSVTAYKEGQCVITATCGGFNTSCTVNVKAKEVNPDVVRVTGISLSESTLSLKVGENKQLSYTITPENATDRNVTWSSSNEAIATVSSGMVYAHKEGLCDIRIISHDGNFVSTCRLTASKVDEPIDPNPDDELPEIDYVKVFADKNLYTNVYAWLNNNGTNTTITDGWPGTKMNSYDDNWLTYDFKGYTALNIIFNNGKDQTDDLYISKAGYYWCTNNRLYNKLPTGDEDESIDLPQGNFELVSSATDYKQLPAVKNYNKGLVQYPYTGSRTDFREESIYFAITTRFYDGDSSNNKQCWDGSNPSDPEWRGDFKGLIEKMDYIKALGFTAIWITPVVKNASGFDYHGYHAINFGEVDPRYESEDVAFKDVIKAAHQRDMKIVLDVVFNHTGNWGEENLYPMFNYDPVNNSMTHGLYYDKVLPGNYPELDPTSQFNARTMALKSASSDGYNIYHHELNMGYEQYIEQTGSMAGDCVDLNTENPTVANYIVDKYGEFIRLGVDAFRVDTMKHISRLTFNKYITPGLYSIAEKCGNNNFFMFGEVCNRVREVWNHNIASDSACFYTWNESKEYSWGDRATNEASTLKHWNDNMNPSVQPTIDNVYLRNGYTYHEPDHSNWSKMGVIDFAMHWNFRYANDAYNVAKNNDSVYNDASYNVVYVDSHDYGPDGIEKVRYNEGTDAWKENMSLMFTFRGVPCIYYGSEIEFQKGKTIDEGPKLLLENSGRAYYGDHLKGTVTASDFGVYTASGTVKDTLDSTLSKHLQQLNKIRLKVPALSKGQYSAHNNQMAFVRRYTKGGIDSLAVVAISNTATFNSLPNGTYVDVVTGTRKTVSNGTLTANVNGGQGSVAIYVLENSYTGTLSQII